MGCTARLDADDAGRQLGKEPMNLGTAKTPLDHRISAGVNAVDLKDMLRNVETDGLDLHDGRLLRKNSCPLQLATPAPGWGPSIPSLFVQGRGAARHGRRRRSLRPGQCLRHR